MCLIIVFVLKNYNLNRNTLLIWSGVLYFLLLMVDTYFNMKYLKNYDWTKKDAGSRVVHTECASCACAPGAFSWVAAVGNPFDLYDTITSGIVSHLNRFSDIQYDNQIRWVSNLIQFDIPFTIGIKSNKMKYMSFHHYVSMIMLIIVFVPFFYSLYHRG